VLKHVFVAQADDVPAPAECHCGTSAFVGLLALAVLALGLYPNALLTPIQKAINAAVNNPARVVAVHASQPQP
jgi:hypothetical protein